MKIGLIAMSGVRVRTERLAKLGVTLPGFVNRGKVVASLPSLGLLTVAALTPKDCEVCYRELADLPKETDELERFDLVGISSFSAQIDEAYALADRYRALGIPVVLGGIHVTLMPEEAAQHADSIVVNGAEGAWPQLVEDFKKGQMKKKYIGLRSQVFDDKNYVMPRFDLLKGRPYNRLTVQTSRGCPLKCDFCAASLRITDSFQQKPVDKVVAEIKEAMKYTDNPFFELADDNTFINKKWSKEFLKAIIPLKISWFTETDISVADDDELLDLLAQSGCKQILIGFESPEQEGLEGMNENKWKYKRFESYLEAINKIQSKGISINGCFIVGLDSNTVKSFEKVRDFVNESKLIEVQITVQTAFPGTPLYTRLKKEGRLLTDRYWDRCTLFDVNYQPKNMSPQELEQGIEWLFTELYSDQAFLKRKRHYMEYIKSGTS
ncbi:MAG: B12-binding domain-containing radical SAM protein [Bdellovibrionales bacterium]|nr:B12-binding domain-containing radical SAM protein [Bdellovibrionales bacterium]